MKVISNTGPASVLDPWKRKTKQAHVHKKGPIEPLPSSPRRECSQPMDPKVRVPILKSPPRKQNFIFQIHQECDPQAHIDQSH
jgi:hypothetical protein